MVKLKHCTFFISKESKKAIILIKWAYTTTKSSLKIFFDVWVGNNKKEWLLLKVL